MSNKNKVKFGLKNGVVWPINGIGPDGKITYGEAIKMPGSVSLSLSPEESSEPFHADDIVYYLSQANNGYSGEWELALVLDDFRTKIMGERIDDNGVLVEATDDKSKEFAYAFEMDGDVHARKFLFPRCAASRIPVEGETKAEANKPKTETMKLTAMGRMDNNITKVVADPESTAYKDWYNKPYEPTFSASGT